MDRPIHSTQDIDALLATHYPNHEPIAVVGYACRFPESDDSDAFWRNLLDGRECSCHPSRQELLAAGMDATAITAPNYVNVGAIVPGADTFDAGLFGYSRHEAESMDPQQRLFLQICWHALEHAGYAPRHIAHKTGVFGSSRISTYPGQEPLRVTDVAQVKGLQSLIGNDKDYVATRVAYKLNLRGPALSVQSACSSSLVAAHLACESLRSGECDMAVAGGVAISFPQQAGYLHQPGMIFSPDGHCRPFDAKAQGTFAGNGVGAVVLRRLGDALATGDPVVAVLPASAINNDGGEKVGYTAPSVGGQQEVIREAMMLAGVESTQIGLIEAHGTATPLGDPIEFQALRGVFHEPAAGPSCALGSIKGNLGHLDTAAGIASLLKSILAVERGVIPPSLHFATPNPALDLANSPFYVPTEAQSWTAAVRIAGVSSFGIGGTNCHMLVSSLPDDLRGADGGADTPPDRTALLLSAASEGALRRLAGAYATALRQATPRDVVHTALHGRQLDLAHRLAVPLCDETAPALAEYASGEEDRLVHHGHREAGGLAWVFTGQGSHWPGMGKALYEHSSAFAQCLDRCLLACGGAFASTLREAMFGNASDRLEHMEYAQPAIIAYELALAAHWRSLGLEPQIVLGHSVGEYAAAVVAGHYEIEQIMPLVRTRGELMQGCAGGTMLAAFGDENVLLALARTFNLDLAAYNGQRHLVFAGAAASIDALAGALSDQGIRHIALTVTGAAHSSLLDPILDEFQGEAAQLHAVPARLPLISTLRGEVIGHDQLNSGNYWRQHMREPVRYVQALHRAIALGAGIFLELGPDSTLTSIGLREIPQGIRWIASTKRQQPEIRQTTQALLQLFAAGINLPWQDVFRSSGRKMHAPLYPFDTERYWKETASTSWSSTRTSIDAALAEGRRTAIRASTTLDLPRLQALYDCVTQLHAIYVDQLVHRCASERFANGATALDILRAGRLLPRHRQLLSRLLNACVKDGYYQRHGDRYAPRRPVPYAQRDALLRELASYCEGFDAIPDTVGRAGEQLFAMMRGEVEPIAVIFPEGSSGGVEVLYQEFSFGRYFNQIAAGVVAGLMRERTTHSRQYSTFRILEVGGGTGGTTAWLLPELVNQPELRYDFTDISALFTRRASEKFSAYNFLDYREFDLQKSAQSQSFDVQSYDLIIAANVIHATQHVGRALKNLRSLLKPGGRLLMREITRPMRLFDFVFGPLVLPLHDEEARGGELFLAAADWELQCLDAGFERVDWLPDDGTPTSDISEHIVLATAPAEPAAITLGWAASGSDPLLGQPLSDDGCYLVDWSDCAGQSELWQSRLQQACQELARRHGAGQSIRPEGLPDTPPAKLSLVRMRWHAEPFGAAYVSFEARDESGRWRSISAASDGSLPGPLSAPDTHYDWCWRPVPQNTSITSETYVLHGAPAALTETLGVSGISVSPQGQCDLLVLEPDADTPQSVAASLLAVLSENPSRPLVIVTRAAWKIHEGESVHPVHHSAWGLLRVAATEQPTRTIAAIDLATDAEWRELLPGLEAIQGRSRWIAVREGKAQSQHLIAQEYVAPDLPLQCFTGDGWHLVTGAFSGLGRLSVQWLAHHGAHRIALLAPRAPEDWPDFQREIGDRYACELRWLPCDTADPAPLKDILCTLQADGGISGAIHAAGILDDTPLLNLAATRLTPVLAVKAHAARVLSDWLCAHQSRYLLLYSSAAAALGSPGQAAHALASAYLDGLAQQRKVNSMPFIGAIAWGAWGETGRVVDKRLQERLAATGMGLLSNAEGLWHLEQTIMRGAPYRLAMRVLREQLGTVQNTLLESPSAADTNAVEINSVPSEPTPSAPKPHDKNAVNAWLKARIAVQLRLADPAQLTPDQDLLQLGLDSLLFLELRSDIERQLGIQIDAERAYRELTVTGLTDLIVSSTAQAHPESVSSELRHDAANRFEPFPLTPIQHAYWLGRTGLIDYGGVACHVLFEWDKRHDEFDLQRFESAWNSLVLHHDMLRMVIDADGCQRILREVPSYRLQRHDLRHLPAAEQAKVLEETRETLSYRILPAERWPLFELVVSELDGQRYRLHMNLDLLLFDVQSFKVMMDDLARAYRGETLEPLRITYRDYVLADQARRNEPSWQESWRYWLDRLPMLPPAPRLPMATAGNHSAPRFTTYQKRLARSAWTALKQVWQTWGATPSAALLGLFAHTLERWSRHPEFTLNLTFFNRRPEHSQVPQLIGDFTSVLLIDFDLSQPQSMRTTIERTQQRLWQHLAHSQVSGVEVIRELSRDHPSGHQPLMPVVFTSMLGMSLDGLSIDQAMTSLLGDPAYVFTQTPQVWLDHQVMEIDGELVFSWYCMDNVLTGDTARAMFEDYYALLRAVATRPETMATIGLSKLREDGIWEAFDRQAWPAHSKDARLDLRDIEDTLRGKHGIRHAEAILRDNDHALDITVVADNAFTAAGSINSSVSYHLADLPTLNHTQLEEFEAHWRWLDDCALHGMIDTLHRHGLFAQQGQRHDMGEIYARVGALPQYHRLLRQWLRLLSERGWLRRDGQTFVGERALYHELKATTPMPPASWCRAIGSYLQACIARHDELFDGTQSPLALLFSDDEAVTRALYSDNPVIDCLNRSAAQLVRALGDGGDGGLLVLEVGAGTGASTRHLLPALDGRLKSYRFTDVSPLFLNEASNQFADHPSLEYGLFDLNAPVNFDDHPPCGYDLIVAVNVLHDASHLVRSLRRLGHLLKAGGHLLLIEATERSSALQMASIGFIESLNGYRDFRSADEKPMLDLPMWRAVLEQAGFTVELAWPAQDRTPLRQHLVLARAERIAHLDLDKIKQTLRGHYGKALPTVQLRQSERLDFHIQPRHTRHKASQPRSAMDTSTPPRNDSTNALEQQIRTIWEELLTRPIQRDSNFFQAGGDSLIATRMIARLNREGVQGAALQALFAHPTLAEFCATLDHSPRASHRNPILLAQGTGSERIFVFHAADGELGAYLPLAHQLGGSVYGLRAADALEATTLDKLTERYVTAIRRVQPSGPYMLLGWSYGTFLAAEAARQLLDQTEQVTLVLLDPICRSDFHCADQTSLLRLLAQGRIPVSLPDDFAKLGTDEQVSVFVRSARTAGMLSDWMDQATAHGWLNRIDHLLDLLARHRQPKPLPIPCLWLAAAHRPSHWRPAEEDWQAWAKSSQRYTLDTDHWALVMEDSHAQHAAALIRQWQERLQLQETTA